jgi:hypothetical protein
MLALIPSAVAMTVGLCLIIAAAFLGGRKEAEEIPAAVSVTEKPSDGICLETEYYIIRESTEGKISVYLSDGELYRELEVYTALLSEKDRNLLRVGIMASSDAELSAFIEGLCG